MSKVLIIRWGEIHLKGKNRGMFEKMLENNIKHAIKDFDLKFCKISGRYLIKDFDDFYTEDIIKKLSKVGGIHSVSPCEVVKSNIDDIISKCVEVAKDLSGTFKVETKRADKSFPMLSVDISR
ncbi:MAG: tRNA 4-thiouridine(8) synthase ThiI, partial [Clostridiales bacterium]|nr:tRNA 4-thiouridine(8) synthase ThiI [Clostridiales bacterium]